jgi:outer membrane protein TolC
MDKSDFLGISAILHFKWLVPGCLGGLGFLRSMKNIAIWLVTLANLVAGSVLADPPQAERLPRVAVEQQADIAATGYPAETLEDAWHTALSTDQRIAASRWNISSASSTAAAAEAERFPSLKLASEFYALTDQPKITAQLPSPLPTVELPFLNSSGVGFQALVNQPIYTFGRISHGIYAADEGVKAYQAEMGRTVLDVKMNVAEIYIVVLRTRRIMDVVDSKVVSLDAHARDVASFFDKGLVPRNDLLAAQVALANARQEAIQVHNMLQEANAAYNRALGRSLDAPVSLAEVQAGEFPEDVEALTQQAMQYRPEIAALSAQGRSLQEQAASLRAKLAPQVAAGGGYVSLQNDYVEPNGIGVVGVGVEWTPVDSGRIKHQAQALMAKAEASNRSCRDAQSMIALEVRQKWLDLQTAIHRIEAIRQATTQAEENLRVARDRYQHQVGTNTEVLDAETLRLQAFTNFYNSSYEALLAELRLRRAIGCL